MVLFVSDRLKELVPAATWYDRGMRRESVVREVLTRLIASEGERTRPWPFLLTFAETISTV